MGSIENYARLIENLPWEDQRASFTKDGSKRWNELLEKAGIKDFDKISKDYKLTRKDVLNESVPQKRVIKTLMWGYPGGGRGQNIKNVLEKLDQIKGLLESIKGESIEKSKLDDVIKEFDRIEGLGISTWSKLLYFFEVTVVGYGKCQIFDLRIEASLAHMNFEELEEIRKIKQTHKDAFFKYIKSVNEVAEKLKVKPDAMELFLFEFNLNYSL